MARKPVTPTPTPAAGAKAAKRTTARASEDAPEPVARARKPAAAEKAANKTAAGASEDAPAPDASKARPAADEQAGAGPARAATAAAVKRRLAFDGLSTAAERVAALPLSDYLSVLRREIARAGAETVEEGDMPLVALAEAEVSLTCVAVAIEDDRLIVDPSWKALSAAPEAAVQRLKVRMIDADMAAALREKR